MTNSPEQDKLLEHLIDEFHEAALSEKYRLFSKFQEFPFEDIQDFLFEALQDNNHRIRSSAAKLIGKLGDETVVARILHMLYDDSWIVRSSAQEALGYLSPEIALPALRGLLSTPGGDPNLRKNLAAVLTRYDLPEATEILVQIYHNADDPDLRATIMEYIGKRKDDTAVSALFEAIRDESWNVRTSAVKALSGMDLQAILKPTLKALADPSRIVHMAAVEILIKFGNDEVIDALADILETANTTGRINALNVLSGIQSDESITMIVSALSDENNSVRNRAIEALASSRSSAVFELLKRCLKSSNWNLKQGAIKTLGIIQTDEAIDLLEEVMSHENTASKVMVLEILSKIGSRRSIRIILENVSLPELGEDAIRIIKMLDPDKSINHLISFLTEDKYYNYTIAALAELDRAKVLRYLTSRIATGTPSQQMKAVDAIAQLGGRESEEYLKKLLDSNLSVELNKTIINALKRVQQKIS
ncbi:HEAT repeat domain-containing protein [bacterium]|nr:HEAT repeat domain-containing protein [candidate division CSSED10-310 bacterium]